MAIIFSVLLPEGQHRFDYEAAWKDVHPLFKDHLWTVCFGILILCIIISAYRRLRSISPALVPFTLLLILMIMLATWTQTRHEPKFLTPVVNVISGFLPQPIQADASGDTPPKKKRIEPKH